MSFLPKSVHALDSVRRLLYDISVVVAIFPNSSAGKHPSSIYFKIYDFHPFDFGLEV